MSQYFIQTKPRIILLLTITGFVAYLIPAVDKVRPIDLFLFVFFGVAAAGGGLTINNVIDKDIDSLMVRTKSRPSIGPNAIPAKNLMIFGIVISAIGIFGGWIWFGHFTAIQLAWGNLFYLFAYSLYLKRKSILNTILGGLASPAPVWAGFAARYEISGIIPQQAFLGIPLEGWLLGILVFVWTPSHTWAMATKNYEDYKSINVPMLPVVVGLKKTGIYTFIFGIITIIYGLFLAIWMIGTYLIALALLIPNLYFLYGLILFYQNPNPETGKQCFVIHNIWLSIMFGIILIFSLI